MLLTSIAEGWPNVVLESMACGTPVVATDVGAVDEMITNPDVGRIVRTRDPASIAAAIAGVTAAPAHRDRIRAHAADFDWESVSAGQFDLMQLALQKGRPGVADAAGAGLDADRDLVGAVRCQRGESRPTTP
jgi:glycosyltransferase involved in cell wall biosynthesis